MSGCQADAVDNPSDSLTQLALAKACINCDTSGPTLGRPPPGSPLTKRAPIECPVNEPEALRPGNGCQHTYTCDGSRFPNVCANVASAINRGKSPILTKRSGGNQNTIGWRNDKDGTGDTGNAETRKVTAATKKASMGWGVSTSAPFHFYYSIRQILSEVNDGNSLLAVRSMNTLLHLGDVQETPHSFDLCQVKKMQTKEFISDNSTPNGPRSLVIKMQQGSQNWILVPIKFSVS